MTNYVKTLSNNDFLIGMGSAFSLFGNYFDYKTCKTPDEADLKALCSDWETVGNDIKTAMESLEKNER